MIIEEKNSLCFENGFSVGQGTGLDIINDIGYGSGFGDAYGCMDGTGRGHSLSECANGYNFYFGHGSGNGIGNINGYGNCEGNGVDTL